jgi:hypothetical protein
MIKFFSSVSLLALVAGLLSTPPSFAQVDAPANRFPCVVSSSGDEPVKDGSCDRYLFASLSYELDSCTYRSFGVEIANSTDGLYRLHVKSANTSGFQRSRTLEIDVHMQENCSFGVSKSAYIVGALVEGSSGTSIRLNPPEVTHNWRGSNTARLPGYCGFRACADSVHTFKAELPENEDFYTITLFFADARTGLNNGLKNNTMVFRDIVFRSSTIADPSSIPFTLGWAKSENGYKCVLRTESTMDQLWQSGVRRMQLFTTNGPLAEVQTKGPNFNVGLINPRTAAGSIVEKKSLAHSAGLLTYDFSGASSLINEYFEMSSSQVYVCRGWLNSLAGSSKALSSVLSPPNSFANPIPVIAPPESEAKNWRETANLTLFRGTTKELSSVQKSQIRSFMRKLPSKGEITCTGYYSFPDTEPRRLLAEARAKAVCAEAKRINRFQDFIYQSDYTNLKRQNGQVVITASGSN